jgi:hypothetical protein
MFKRIINLNPNLWRQFQNVKKFDKDSMQTCDDDEFSHSGESGSSPEGVHWATERLPVNSFVVVLDRKNRITSKFLINNF